MKLKDLYFYCRAHHRQLWSTIARMDDGEIINAGFDIETIKKTIVETMDDVDMSVVACCFACEYAAWVEAHTGKYKDSITWCDHCPIKQNVGKCSDPDHGNTWIDFMEMETNYLVNTITLGNVSAYCEYFRDCALRMANAW